MLSLSLPEFWWQGITGPAEIVRSVVDGLTETGVVVLAIPYDLPWRRDMRRAVQSEFDGLTVYTVDDTDDLIDGVLPGEYLLKRYAIKSDRLYYRSGMGSIQKYLIEKGVLKDSLIWVKGLSRSAYEEWISFCSGYHGDGMSDGLFVIEAVDFDLSHVPPEYAIVEYESIASDYDARLFNSLVLSDINDDGISEEWKKYIAAVVTNLCGLDVEVADRLIHGVNFKEDDPIGKLEELSKSEDFTKRGSNELSGHPFSICRTGNVESLKKKVWDAQIEVLFPRIETERLSIIDELDSELNYLVSKNSLYQFDEQIEDAREIELGTLTYLMGSGQLDVPDAELRSRIFLLRDSRNKLAHRECLTASEVRRLLG